MTHRTERLSMAKLKARGWTDSMIRRLLAEPDATAVNPKYKNAHPMRLYDLSRIEAAEATTEFASSLERATQRSETAKTVADGKRRELVAEVRSVTVRIDAIDIGELTRLAVDSYNARTSHKASRAGHQPATPASDRPFLDRILVNHARHGLTRYDDRLEDLYRRIGKKEAIEAIRRATYRAIAEAWPVLAGECRRQMAARMRQ